MVGSLGFHHVSLVQMAAGRKAHWRGKDLHWAFTGQWEASKVSFSWEMKSRHATCTWGGGGVVSLPTVATCTCSYSQESHGGVLHMRHPKPGRAMWVHC